MMPGKTTRLRFRGAFLILVAVAATAGASPAVAQDEDVKISEEEHIARQKRARDERRQAWYNRRNQLENDISQLRSRVSQLEYDEPSARQAAEQYSVAVNTLRANYQMLQMQLSSCGGDYVYCNNLAAQGQQMYYQLNDLISRANQAINRHNDVVNRLNASNDRLNGKVSDLNNMGSNPPD